MTNHDDNDDNEVEHCGTQTVYQAVAARTQQAAREGRLIDVDGDTVVIDIVDDNDKNGQQRVSANTTATATTPTTAVGHTIRRLSDDDVRAIFECLHHRAPLPARLKFTIVPAGANGLKLSPPSYEFQDGLFVLLRPHKKTKSGQTVNPADIPRAPLHLQHLVVPNWDEWAETCPWSLSGPQFPQPTTIQQRYCYPKGSPAYSSRVGGALWTMYGTDEKEDLEFRLLHVYYSAKRAVNKGVASGPVAKMDKCTLSPSDASLIGRRVYKNFGKEWYFGTVDGITEVVEQDDNCDDEFYYRVKYDDDDAEDMNLEELQPWLLLGETYRYKDPKAKKKSTKAAARARDSVKTEPPSTPTRKDPKAKSTVVVKRERTENASVVTPPPKKKRDPPPRYQASMCTSSVEWVKNMATWLEQQNNTSFQNGKSIIRQVEKMAQGKGVGYLAWPSDVVFLTGQAITLEYDFDQFMQEARRYEQKYGEDKGHGWLLRHPIKRLKLFQTHCGIRPTKKAIFK